MPKLLDFNDGIDIDGTDLLILVKTVGSSLSSMSLRTMRAVNETKVLLTVMGGKDTYQDTEF